MTETELKNFYLNDLKPRLKKIEKDRLRAVLNFMSAALCLVLIGVTFFLTYLFQLTAEICLPTTFILMGTGGYFVNNGYKTFGRYKTIFKKIVVKQIVKQFDPNWKYFHDRKIKTTDFEKSGLISKYYSRVTGDDLVVGQIEKTKFYSSELHVEKLINSGKGSSHKTLFKGLFFFADFNKIINSETYLLHKPKKTIPRFLSASIQALFRNLIGSNKHHVEVENQELNKRFYIQAKDQQEARYILTPSIIEAILAFQKKIGKPIDLSFKQNRVYVAINFGKELFEPRLFRTNVKFSEVRFMKMLFETNITLVRELDLNTRIWTKE